MHRLKGRRLPRRLLQLYAGLALYGVSMALLVRSELGVMPWDVLHQGLARQLGWSLGAVTVLVGALVLLAWVPLRQRPGLGTVSNVVVIGLAVDGGAKVAATQRANAIADEAARAGGQALDVSAALAGQVRVDSAAAVAAAQDYLDRNGVQGAVTVVDGDTLTVTTTITEPTTFLGLIGIQTMTVEGSGTADLITDQSGGAEP